MRCDWLEEGSLDGARDLAAKGHAYLVVDDWEENFALDFPRRIERGASTGRQSHGCRAALKYVFDMQGGGPAQPNEKARSGVSRLLHHYGRAHIR